MPISRPNLLYSYAYIRKSRRSEGVWRAVASASNLMVDSGAFTDFHATRKAAAAGVRHSPITLAEYVAFCRRLQAAGVGDYIQLDKIMDLEASRRNLDEMRQAGLTPIPVVTVKEDPAVVEEHAAVRDYVCVAGGGLSKWAQVARYNSVADAARKAGVAARLHGLGFADWKYFFRARLFSGDVSTFTNGSKFGCLGLFDRQAGLVTTALTRAKAFNKLADPASARFRSHLVRCGFTPAEIADKASYTGMLSPSCLTTVHAYLLYMAYCETQGRRLYLAVGGVNWFQLIAAVRAASRKDGTFSRASAVAEYARLRSSGPGDLECELLAEALSRPPGCAA